MLSVFVFTFVQLNMLKHLLIDLPALNVIFRLQRLWMRSSGNLPCLFPDKFPLAHYFCISRAQLHFCSVTPNPTSVLTFVLIASFFAMVFYLSLDCWSTFQYLLRKTIFPEFLYATFGKAFGYVLKPLYKLSSLEYLLFKIFVILQP